MKTFTEQLRYEYPLKPDDLVIDAGGYEGNWAAEISRKYGCHVLVFEPVKKFSTNLTLRFANNPLVHIDDRGLGGQEYGAGKDVTFHIQNDSTGAFAGSPETEEVTLVSAGYLIHNMPTDVALLKLNIEGMEYDVIETLLDRELTGRIKNIQVQFHTCAPDYDARYRAIHERLSKTHHLTYHAPFVWENWEINS